MYNYQEQTETNQSNFLLWQSNLVYEREAEDVIYLDLETVLTLSHMTVSYANYGNMF